MPGTRKEVICREHHVPRDQCPPSATHPRTVRLRDDTWKQAEDLAGAASGVIVPAAEAFLGFVRCRRCQAEVPLRPGDVTGLTLPEAAEQARRRVLHPAHEPVWLGAEPVPADITATFDHLRAQVGEVLDRVSPSGRPVTPVFRAPA
jgi:hypothetical protein